MEYDQYKLETPSHFAEEVEIQEKDQNDCYVHLLLNLKIC